VDLPGHRQNRVALGGVRGQGQPRLYQKPVSILHHDVAQIAQLAPGSLGFLVQPLVGVGRGQMRFVASLFAVKIHLVIPAAPPVVPGLPAKTPVAGSTSSNVPSTVNARLIERVSWSDWNPDPNGLLSMSRQRPLSKQRTKP
jgi:hypothetical protein